MAPLQPDPFGFIPANWYYRFTATTDGLFSMNYSVTHSGSDLFGLGSLILVGFLDDGMPTFSEFLFGSGNATIPLLAGETYRIYLYNFGNVSGNLDTSTAAASARIDWNITYAGAEGEIPEPAMPALIALGLLALAAGRRKSAHL